MTGENGPRSPGPSGGITTQNTGPQPQRARLRATKAPTGLLSQPDRTVRVGSAHVVHAHAGLTPPQPPSTRPPWTTASTNDATHRANGLSRGQYVAPIFEYIFPENVKPGTPVPNDLWHLPFLVNGEGAGNAGEAGALAVAGG